MRILCPLRVAYLEKEKPHMKIVLLTTNRKIVIFFDDLVLESRMEKGDRGVWRTSDHLQMMIYDFSLFSSKCLTNRICGWRKFH